MKVKDIMDTEFLYLSEDDTIKKSLEVMTLNNAHGAPILNKNKEILGIVVKADIYRFLMEPGHYDTYNIGSVMITDIISVSEEESVGEAALRLRKNNIIAMPVLKYKEILGFVSLENIVDYFIRQNAN